VQHSSHHHEQIPKSMQHTKDIVPYKQIKIISKGFSADRKKRETV